MSGQGTWVIVAVMVVLTLGQWWWRRGAAREVAVDWLQRHGYRVRSLRMPFTPGPVFGVRLLRDSDHAFAFRAEVDDRKLGGSGVVWLRVWTGWLGATSDDIDVRWERLPEGGGEGGGAASRADSSLESRLADGQLAVLRAVAEGITIFRPEGRTPEAAAAFDERVEHLLALERRGLVSCSSPLAETRAGRGLYAAVRDVALTDAGRRELERRAAAAT